MNNKLFKIIFVLLCLIAAFVLGINIEKELPTLETRLLRLLPYKVSASQNITPEELKKMLASKDFTFINVHVPYEGEIEKTDSFIEYDEMVASKDKLPKDKAAKIVLYCKTGRMSAEALKTLKTMGYTNVSHLEVGMDAWAKEGNLVLNLQSLPGEVLPKEGVTLPVSWGDIGKKLISLGVIDLAKFNEATKLTEEQKEILTNGSKSLITINSQNSHFIVNMLWALGLAQKSIVYDEGPFGKEYKATVGNFASTGGWSLAKGNAVDYLNKFDLIPLSPNQQRRVADISKNIYRPCCGNPTWFPDCNHGMAALAAIELFVSKGIDDDEIYKYILGLNSFWFPDNYLTVATYFARQGTPWSQVDAKEVLGEKYSSSKGASEVYAKVGPLPYKVEGVGGSCGA